MVNVYIPYTLSVWDKILFVIFTSFTSFCRSNPNCVSLVSPTVEVQLFQNNLGYVGQLGGLERRPGGFFGP